MFKKLIRSVQVLQPNSLDDMKYAIRDFLHQTIPGLFKPELDGIKHLELADSLAVDVGAHRGETLVAFRRNNIRHIVAFEPNKVLAAKLSGKYKDVQVLDCGLSDKPGIFELTIPHYRGYRFDGLAATGNATETIDFLTQERFFRFDPGKIYIERHEVLCQTLDSFCLSVGLLKLHAQRAEVSILLGARETIEKHKPVIITAWTFAKEAELLEQYGYTSAAYSKGSFSFNKFGYEFTYWFLPIHQAYQSSRELIGGQ
jgi:FkbM family methyltransferase